MALILDDLDDVPGEAGASPADAFDYATTRKGYYKAVAPDGTVLSEHTDILYAEQACLRHALKNRVNGKYSVAPPTQWEIKTMGFGVVSVPPPQPPGQVWVESTAYSVLEGGVLWVGVRRGNGSFGAIAVDWSLTGIAQGAPSNVSGTLTWAAGESGVKTLSFQMGTISATQNGAFALSNARATTAGNPAPTIATATAAVVLQNDTQPPSVPTGLAVVSATQNSISVQCNASTDNTSVAGYRWFRDGTFVQQTSSPSYTFTGLLPGTSYQLRVAARDVNNNDSAQSSAITGSTQAVQGLLWDEDGQVTDLQFTQGQPVDYDIAARVVGETSIVLLSGSVPGLTYNESTRRLTGTPTTVNTNPGSNLSFRASDGQSGGGGSAAADWQARISDPGVVWYHNFDSAAEVNAFRWSGGYQGGNDPNANAPGASNVAWVASGGADGGGYMQLTRTGSNVDDKYWHRPFNPLTGASNGRGVDDPGANGTMAPQTFIATNGGSQLYNWCASSNPKQGWYGHSSYVDSRFDGTDFYVQLRVMADPRRTTPGNIRVGKFTSFTTTNFSYTAQELVTYGGYWEGDAAVGKANIHNLYRGVDYSPIDSSIATGTINPNSPKWAYSGGWDTILYHVTPGLNGGTGANRTRIEVWGAHPGETSYTKFWDVLVPMSFDQGGNSAGTLARNGWNAMLCWIYHNGASMSEFWQRYDQIIFSKAFIACPQV